MAVYNEGRFIEDAIQSVLSQSYDNYELIICDDGSEDNTPQILQKFEENPKITVLLRPHRGHVPTINEAFYHSTGDAVCYLPGDDVLERESIEMRVQALDSGENAAYINGYVCDQKLNCYDQIFDRRYDLYWDRDNKTACQRNLISGALLLFKKEIAEKIFPIPENISFEDWWMTYLVLLYAGKIKYIDKPLFLYRQHDSNLCGSFKRPDVSNEQILKDWKFHVVLYDELINYLRKADDSIENSDELMKCLIYNKNLVKNTINRTITLPTISMIQNTGIMKYGLSQLTVLGIGNFGYKIYYLLQKIKKGT